MTGPTDLITWTEEEVILRVHDLLSENQTLECVPGEDSWEIILYKVAETEDAEGEKVSPEEVLWRDTDLTRRGAYFKAYYRLWVPPDRGRDDPWTLSPNRPTLRAVAGRLTEKFADPEDLDPEAVASVYSKTNSQPRRK